jgi:hypothetical protein
MPSIGTGMTDSSTTRLGGSPEVFKATLTIEGEDLLPDDISARLGSIPDESQKKGDVRKRGILYRRGAWSITAAMVGQQSPAEVVEVLLARLPDSSEIWAEIRRTYEVSLNVFVVVSGNRDFVLSPAQVARLSMMGASIWVDVYAGPDE